MISRLLRQTPAKAHNNTDTEMIQMTTFKLKVNQNDSPVKLEVLR